MAVMIEDAGSETFRWSGQTVLFSVANFLTAGNRHQYDVAPDGQRFVFLQFTENADPTEVIIVENWFEELKRDGNR